MKISNDQYFIFANQDDFNPKSMAIANAMAIELMNYYVYTTRDLLHEISYTDSNTAMQFCSNVLKDYTVGKLNRPLFPNWESRTEFTFTEMVVQIFGYVVQLSGNDLQDPSYMEKLLDRVNLTEEKRVALAPKLVARSLFFDLAYSKVPLEKDRLKTLVGLAEVFYSDCEFNKRIYSDESRIAVLLNLSKKIGLFNALTKLQCKPIDTLRYAATLLNFDQVKLPSDVLYANLTWKQRTELLAYLDTFSYEELFEATGLNRQVWTKFYKHIHLFSQKDFINRYKTIGFVARVSMGYKEEVIPRQYFKTLDKFLEEGIVESTESENLVYRTFASRIQTAINNKDFYKIKSLLENNGSYLLRNLATVSTGIHKNFEQEFIELVKSKLPTASVDLLFSILGINVNSEYRVIDIKGNTVIEEANYPDFITTIQQEIKVELNRKYGLSGKIIVEGKLRDKVVPFLSRNSDLDRGSKIKIGSSKYLYMFVHWVQSNSRRTDLDLSAVTFDSNWDQTTVYFGNQANSYISHSGDITNAPAPNGATEYIRINMSSIPKDKKYILPIINVYAGDVFSNNDVAYAGFMLSDSKEFCLEQEHVRYDLAQPANSNIPFMLDTENNEIIILDFNNRQSNGYTAYSEIGTMKKLISASLDRNIITIDKFAKILSGSSNKTELSVVSTVKSENEIEPADLIKLFSKNA